MSEFPSVPGYRVIGLLGEGGMGRVYLAEDVALGRRTAIKFVSERMSADPDARARFLREARTMATVEHAHVVRVYSFGESTGNAYLVMEYVAGESLSERLKRTRKLEATEAIRITRQVTEALDAAWEQHLVHRDIKPSNILIDTKGQVRVADFGLAKPIGLSASDEGLTQAGSILGTPHYVSPEQARGHPADIRSDIYSLGIVLFEMIAGERPFEGRTAFDITAKHMHEALPSLEARRPDLPAGVAALVSFMAQKDPDRRPQSYGELRECLRTLGDGGVSTPIPASKTQAAGVRRGSFPRLRLAGLAGLLLLLAGIAFRTSRDRGALPPPADERLVVAVTPFSGPDDDSAKEGKVMAALIERAINERLPKDDVRLIGIDQTREPVRDHASARTLGERLGANAVIWGQAFALRGETEIQPYLTLVPRRAMEKKATVNVGSLVRDPLAALAESSGSSLVMDARAPNQIELRKTGAAGVSDLVMTLAASHALAGGKADKALALLEQAPRTVENLQRRADSLLMLDKAEAARLVLKEAEALRPDDAQTQASLGDVLLTTGSFPAAVTAYTKAAASGRPYRSREAILYEGKLYRREMYRHFQQRFQTSDTLYMLGLDPKTGRVLERHPLPGTLVGLSSSESGITISYVTGWSGDLFEAQIGFSRGAFIRPVFPPPNLLLLRRRATSGAELGRNFLSEAGFRPSVKYAHVPKDFQTLDQALNRALAMDATQPWYPFLLGQSAWAQGRKNEAEGKWRELFASAFPGVPYSTFTWMALEFERSGQPEWADRAYEEARKRRKAHPQSLSGALIERLVNSPVVSNAARLLRAGGDAERAHLWLARERDLGGLTEGDETAAAIWETHFRERGDGARAETEASVRRRASAAPWSRDRLILRIDAALTLFLGVSVSAWLVLTALIAKGRRRARGRVGAKPSLRVAFAEISQSERRTMLLSPLLALAALAFVGAQANRIDAASSIPVALSDSLGNAAALRWVDKLVEESGNKRAAQFLAGVAHHSAGDVQAAQRHYGAIPDHTRAQINLAALVQGQFTPPAPANHGDAMEAVGVGMTFPGLFFGPAPVAFGVLGILGLGITFSVWRRSGPNREVRSASEGPTLWDKLIPGVLDLLHGSPVRGQITLSLAGVSLVALGIALWTTRFAPVFGIAAAVSTRSLMTGFPLPPHTFWTEFWAQPGASGYWSGVGVAAAAATILQILALRRLRKKEEAGIQADPSLSSLDTRVRG